MKTHIALVHYQMHNIEHLETKKLFLKSALSPHWENATVLYFTFADSFPLSQVLSRNFLIFGKKSILHPSVSATVIPSWQLEITALKL